jgi:hypothetical protein
MLPTDAANTVEGDRSHLSDNRTNYVLSDSEHYGYELVRSAIF